MASGSNAATSEACLCSLPASKPTEPSPAPSGTSLAPVSTASLRRRDDCVLEGRMGQKTLRPMRRMSSACGMCPSQMSHVQAACGRREEGSGRGREGGGEAGREMEARGRGAWQVCTRRARGVWRTAAAAAAAAISGGSRRVEAVLTWMSGWFRRFSSRTSSHRSILPAEGGRQGRHERIRRPATATKPLNRPSTPPLCCCSRLLKPPAAAALPPAHPPQSSGGRRGRGCRSRPGKTKASRARPRGPRGPAGGGGGGEGGRLEAGVRSGEAGRPPRALPSQLQHHSAALLKRCNWPHKQSSSAPA